MDAVYQLNEKEKKRKRHSDYYMKVAAVVLSLVIPVKP